MKEVTEYIEIVFEKVQLENIVEFIIQNISSSILKSYHISTDLTNINLHSKDKLYHDIDQSLDGAFYFNFSNFNLKNILLSQVGIQILKYDRTYDLNFHIHKMELSQKTSVPNLQGNVQLLAEELRATNYYCGYEPAIDVETRYFSGDIIGPIKNWSNE